MCGFAGEFVFAVGGRADLAVAEAMAARLAHRGPDEVGKFISTDGRCAIGFRRLAVLDPARSHQPMSTPDGKLTVAFNGEIYNYRELRLQMAAIGTPFTTEGDTEVLLRLIGIYSAESVIRLTGMFAFALYDAEAGNLLLARDRLGQKPLWYAMFDDRVVFASELKGLQQHPKVSSDVSPLSIITYISMGYAPGPGSARAGIKKHPPGHTLEISDRPAEPIRYWKPDRVSLPADPAGRAELIRQHLQRSVTQRLVSDVPLGILLSGGVDSSIVTALACRSAGSAGGIRTFTAGFEDADYDERPIAQEVADRFGTDHTELLIRPEFDGAIDRIVDMYDEPFADSSALPTYLICREARQHVTVALGGDGGDEAFGGYDRYRALHLANRMSPLGYLATRVAAAMARPFAGHDERNRWVRFCRFADALPLPAAQQYFRYRCLFEPDDLAFLLTDEFAASVDLQAPMRWFGDLYEASDVDDEVTRAQLHDLATYLPDDLLVKTDIASMASGLELRAPMLDERVIHVGLSLPVEEKVSHHGGKIGLRAAFRDILPQSVLDAPKRGFGVPLAKWLRGPLREQMQETLLDDTLQSAGIFRRVAVRGLINDHLSGKRNYAHRLWALMVFARWFVRGGYSL
jgi:asparagine synthase (glutamine-hydrolysing)